MTRSIWGRSRQKEPDGTDESSILPLTLRSVARGTLAGPKVPYGAGPTPRRTSIRCADAGVESGGRRGEEPVGTTTRYVAEARELSRRARGGEALPAQRVLRVAYGLSAVIAALMIAASAAGLFIDGLYPDGPWAREAFRGGDLTTLALAAPVLVVSLVLSIRGSLRAQAVWIGALA